MLLDLLPFAQNCKTKSDSSGTFIWCQIRKSWLVAQPEELVRQGFISYLKLKGYPLNLMQVEKKVGTSKDRLDLLVFDRQQQAFLLVEMKAPGIPLDGAVRQLARYNRIWRAPYTLAVNGDEARCFSIDWSKEEVKSLSKIPDFL